MIRKHILPILLVIIIGAIAFRLSFGLSLFGDDWLVLYIFKYQVQHGNFGSIPFDLVSYLSPYGPTYLIMGIIDKFFGLNPIPYFAASLFFRSLVSISLYILVFQITKNRLSAFVASLFWAVSEIGIESTNWVFNMNSYLGLAIFLIVVALVLKYHETSKKILLLTSVPLFLLSVISVPVRMHGAFIVLFLIETYFLFKNWKGIVSIKKFILINSIWVISFFILSSWGVLGSGSSNFDTYVRKGLKENSEAMENGHYEQYLYPLTTIGNMIFTDQYMNHVQIPRTVYKAQNMSWLRAFLLPFWVLFSIVLTALGVLLIEKKNRKKFIIAICLLMLILIFTINFFVRISTNTMSPNTVFLTMVGGALIVTSTLLIFFAKQDNIRKSLFIGLFWLVGFAAVPFVFTPLTYIPSAMRYLIAPGISIAILIGVLFAIKKSNLQNFMLALLVIPLYLIQYSSTQSYLKNLIVTHSEDISQTVWKNILTKIPNLDPKKDYLFYFEPKNGNDSIVRDVITFGFIPRMIVYEKSPDRPGSLYVIENREQFKSAIKDGEKLKGFNWGVAKKIDVRNTFAFRLEPDNSLTDIKSEILYGTR
ncbi:MAG TPA: hypothetical protein VFI61_01425 [Patescibacteria group bacterium]|nr:hypothetical protein [Patescibacteria group bacterium]